MSGQSIHNSQDGQGWEGRARISVCTSPSELLSIYLVEMSNGLWAPGAGLSWVDIVGCDVREKWDPGRSPRGPDQQRTEVKGKHGSAQGTAWLVRHPGRQSSCFQDGACYLDGHAKGLGSQ